MPSKWPITKTDRCVLCGTRVTLHRQGDGKPWRGRPNYYYTSPEHDCPDRDEAQALSRGLNAVFLGGRPDAS